jgi:hypothetical protein
MLKVRLKSKKMLTVSSFRESGHVSQGSFQTPSQFNIHKNPHPNISQKDIRRAPF